MHNGHCWSVRYSVSYIGFGVSVMSLISRGNWSSSARKTAHSRCFFILFDSAPMFGKRKDAFEYVLTGVGSRFVGGASLIYCTSSRVVAACCTFYRRASILRVFIQRPSDSSSFLGRRRSRGLFCSKYVRFLN